MTGHSRFRCVLCAAIALALAAAALLVEASPARADEKADRRKKAAEERERMRREKQRGPTSQGVLARLDTDRDGRISKDEWFVEAYERFGGKTAGKKAGAVDKDEDGKVSAEEFKASPQPNDRWKKLDKDGSGFLETAEVESMTVDLGREQRKKLPEFLKRYDDDGDGKVARAEFTGAEAVFDRLDANGDDLIDERDEPAGPAPAASPAPATSANPAPPPTAPSEPVIRSRA